MHCPLCNIFLLYMLVVVQSAAAMFSINSPRKYVVTKQAKVILSWGYFSDREVK